MYTSATLILWKEKNVFNILAHTVVRRQLSILTTESGFVCDTCINFAYLVFWIYNVYAAVLCISIINTFNQFKSAKKYRGLNLLYNIGWIVSGNNNNNNNKRKLFGNRQYRYELGFQPPNLPVALHVFLKQNYQVPFRQKIIHFCCKTATMLLRESLNYTL